jgi:hemolysin activation/secretion protein
MDAPGVRLALPMGVGDILQLRDIEQGLDQLNRLRGRQAQVRIVPGQTPGGSVLEFVDPPASVGLARLAGRRQPGQPCHRRAAPAPGPGDGRPASASTRTSTSATRAAWRPMRSTPACPSPWGYNTFTLLTTWSEYQSLIGNVALLHGSSTNQAASWNRLLFRDRDTKVAADLALSVREARREINNVVLAPRSSPCCGPASTA